MLYPSCCGSRPGASHHPLAGPSRRLPRRALLPALVPASSHPMHACCCRHDAAEACACRVNHGIHQGWGLEMLQTSANQRQRCASRHLGFTNLMLVLPSVCVSELGVIMHPAPGRVLGYPSLLYTKTNKIVLYSALKLKMPSLSRCPALSPSLAYIKPLPSQSIAIMRRLEPNTDVLLGR